VDNFHFSVDNFRTNRKQNVRGTEFFGVGHFRR
jgi:hypothetical protein